MASTHDYNLLYNAAKTSGEQEFGGDFQISADHVLCAILKPSASRVSPEPSDFTFFRGRAFHTIKKIIDKYPAGEELKIQLLYKGILLLSTDMLGEFDLGEDQFIVFEAIKQGSLSSNQNNRTPVEAALKSTPSTPQFQAPRGVGSQAGSPLAVSHSPSSVDSSNSPFGERYAKRVSSITQATKVLGLESILNSSPDRTSTSSTLGARSFRNVAGQGIIRQGAPVFANSTSSSPIHFTDSSSPPKASTPSAQLSKAGQGLPLTAKSAPSVTDKVEAEVRKNAAVLDELRLQLEAMLPRFAGAEKWLKQLDNLQKLNSASPTIIGIMGQTGAGKSSVLNAILDEARLVPTNCMRSCTAVVTEISYNHANDESARYRAEIEFIGPEDWEKELKILLEEVLDSSGNISREYNRPETQAGIAFHKIKAVYPQKTHAEIATSTLQSLLQDKHVKAVLGQTKCHVEGDVDVFYDKLQQYVDSVDRSTEDGRKKPQEESKSMEYWPLVKVVKIFTKAQCISTGAMLVDLPGTNDSNAARSAVAENYMKRCTGLWIVSPILRAVTDKAAKDLLGESFKRQLKYDGIYSRVSFICSKTDDISIEEAAKDLHLSKKLPVDWAQYEQVHAEQDRLLGELKALEDDIQMHCDIGHDSGEQLEVWKDLEQDLADGKVAYAPETNSRKRAAAPIRGRRSKRVAANNKSYVEYSSSDSEDEDELGYDGDVSLAMPRQLVSFDDVKLKIKELSLKETNARVAIADANKRKISVKASIKKLKPIFKEIDNKIARICITGRNEWSKKEIQKDFADGIRELDEENAIEEDEESYDPDKELRDYETVAESLPVFCISSKAYQILRGRFRKERKIIGYLSLEDTEIPQLQNHAEELTETGRMATCHAFLNSYRQSMSSLSFWALDKVVKTALTEAEKEADCRFLNARLGALKESLSSKAIASLKEIRRALSKCIYGKFDDVINNAVSQAPTTVEKWGAKVDRDNRGQGGLHYQTYKAICRRDGIFTGSYGLHDFNGQLTNPIQNRLMASWEKGLNKDIPKILPKFAGEVKTQLQSFHEDVQKYASQRGCDAADLALLGQQMVNQQRVFFDLAPTLNGIINDKQKDANRNFTPVVARYLAPAYNFCLQASGPGSFAQMKAYMHMFIDSHSQAMFLASCMKVKGMLDEMCDEVEKKMNSTWIDKFEVIKDDYTAVIVGAADRAIGEELEWQKKQKAVICGILKAHKEVSESNVE